jgi:Family of unknown function (DUF5906)
MEVRLIGSLPTYMCASAACEAKWEDFAKASLPENRVTWRSVILLARKNGWVAQGATFAALAEENDADELDKINMRFAWVDKQSSIWRFEQRNFISPDAFFNSLANVHTFDKKGEKKPAARIWMTSPRRREHKDVVFAPGEPAITKDNCINLWQGWGAVAKGGDVRPFLDLIAHVCNHDQTTGQHLLKWLAYPLQNPGAKLMTAVQIFSRTHGVGKSTLAEMIARLYGEAHWTKIGNAELEAPFNGWLRGKQFIIGEEISIGDKRSIMPKLKELITSQTCQINEKYQPRVQTRNCANCLFLSNDATPVYLEDKDRRFFVINAAEVQISPDVVRGTWDW